MIFRLVPFRHYKPPTGTDQFLAYVERFNVVHRESATGMYQVKRARRVDNFPMGDIIPLDRLRASADLSPRFGKVANKKFTSHNTFELCDNFWLNHFYTKEHLWTLVE